MIPAAVAELLPTTLEILGETAGHGYQLGRMLAAAMGPSGQYGGGTFLRFWNAAVKAGFARSDISNLYQGAKFWLDQSAILTAYPPDVPWDPHLAWTIQEQRGFIGEYVPYEARVSINVVDPNTGQQWQFYRFLPFRQPPSWNELNAAVHDYVAEAQDLQTGSPPLPEAPTLDVSWTLEDFARDIP